MEQKNLFHIPLELIDCVLIIIRHSAVMDSGIPLVSKHFENLPMQIVIRKRERRTLD